MTRPGKLEARWLARALFAAALAAAGCAPPAAAPPPAPVDVAAGADRLLARDLADPGLRRFLAERGIAAGSWPPEAWTLDALTAAAVWFDDGIALARARWREAAAAEATAGQRAGPVLAPALAWDSQPDSPDDSPLTVGLSVTLPLGGADRRAARRALARAEAEAAALDTMRRGWQRRAVLRRAAVACHAAENRLAGIAAQRRIHERIAALHERRLALGEAGAGAVARARHRAEEAAREEARFTGARATCRGRLAAGLGVPARAVAALRLDTAALERAETLAVPAAEARRAALTGRLDIRAALSRHAAAEARLALEIARRQPEFTLEPGLFWDQGGLVWSVGSEIGRWLLPGGDGPVREAAAARETAARAVLARQTEILAALSAADADLAAARLRREAARAAVQRGADLRAIAETRRARGEAGRLAVLEAELGQAAAAGAETGAWLAVLAAVAAYEDIVERVLIGAPDFDVAGLALAAPDR